MYGSISLSKVKVRSRDKKSKVRSRVKGQKVVGLVEF